MDRQWLKEALFGGMTSNAFKLGTTLTLGWFWSRTAGCCVLYRGLGMEQIDFSSILAVVELEVDTISVPSYIPHDKGLTYFYVVRRVNGCGYQERTLSAAIKMPIDPEGNLAEPQPNKIFGWRAEQIKANKIRLIWYYCPLGQKSEPAGFNIYFDNGTGQIDYQVPITTISYGGRKFYSFQSQGLQAGTYLLAIRTEDTKGAEDSSLASIRIQLDTSGPDAVEVLSVETV